MEVCEQIKQFPVSRLLVPIGHITAVRGQSLVASGVRMAVGEVGKIQLSETQEVEVECVGFLEDHRVLLTPYHDVMGIRPGLAVIAKGRPFSMVSGKEVLGRLLDGIGKPLDRGPMPIGPRRFLTTVPMSPLSRQAVDNILWTGIRAIDGLLTLGQGQRVGVFAGAGFGKTTLLQEILNGTEADIVVVGLIGERGREVAEFFRQLGPEAKKRTVIIAATSDMPAIMRLKAAWAATLIAEDFRDQGYQVLLVMDSLTRVALAQREIGMETGELPSARGYTPSVLHLLPRLLERAGATEKGSITGIYTVLVDGDDPYEDPLSDILRGLLDGHIILSRQLAHRGHFPAIDVVGSLSRLMPDIVSEKHLQMARSFKEIVARVKEAEDLLEVGAYTPGRDVLLDQALNIYPTIQTFLDQKRGERCQPQELLSQMEGIFDTITHLRRDDHANEKENDG
ncbi:MAG: EscN/YscN/HrcN family type III secretion system ATPase [Sulfobacillus thermosulfidooxidans]|uniref:EscN/YscN/HrcN family type III secretion system ATPase n=1 Tax=Sulfobacillus thermosulfidooxidans TaxID=28034 RepID=A0A2T2WXY5_SULTH|nr:MAG: EscN/YscN/HrcN family type III secretion system ATPase [Sulfobacillus thermosulfidooxidans]